MNYIIKTLFFLLLASNFVYAQNSKVIAGPMISFIDYYGTEIWFLLDTDVKTIEIDIRDYENDKLLEYDFDVTHENQFDTYTPFTVLLDKLLPNQEYIASISVDGVFVKEIDIFTKRPHLDDIQFLLGYNIGSTPSNIFSYMQQTNSDFMVWLGGHVNLQKPLTFKNVMNSYIDIRKKPYLNEFMSSIPQIATWNDLDYGIENKGDFLAMRDSIYLAFDLFWPNSVRKTYNYTYYDYGTYQRYTYNDVDVFLLDSETFDNTNTLYGDKQLERLFQEINNTGSTFTIIASSTPFTFEAKESFLNYGKQFKYFMERLQIAKPNGLILVTTGAKEGTKLNRIHFSSDKELNNNSSSVTEFNISSLADNNYSLISVKGSSKDRILSFETYNQNGNLIYKKSFHQNELTN